jgi:hypothetical protein
MPEEDSTSGCVAFKTCEGSIVTKATMLRAVFDKHGLAGKPMLETEGSWGDGNVTGSDAQAAWLARWYLLLAGLRSSLNMETAIWFTWGWPGGMPLNWGTIEDAAGNPTQAAAAYNQVEGWLVGGSIARPCAAASGGIWSCTVARPGGYSALIVWTVHGAATYLPTATYADYRDLTGAVTKIAKGASVPIGEKPIMLESGPIGGG